jgi:hypothetical protein
MAAIDCFFVSFRSLNALAVTFDHVPPLEAVVDDVHALDADQPLSSP